MTVVHVHLNNDGLGGVRWWASSDAGFFGGADSLAELKREIRVWAADEHLADDLSIRLVDDQAEEVINRISRTQVVRTE